MAVAQKIVIKLIREDDTVEVVANNLLKSVELTRRFNDHSWIFFSYGAIKPSEKDDYLLQTGMGTKIQVDYIEENRKIKAIFEGIVTKIELVYEPSNVTYFAKITGASYSYFMDLGSCSRSFQNNEMTYDKLFSAMEEDYTTKSTYANITAGKEFKISQAEKKSENAKIDQKVKKLGKFTMQYMETDWKFLKRMASRFQTGLIVNPIAPQPIVNVGMPEDESSSNPVIFNPQRLISVRKRVAKHWDAEANYNQQTMAEEYLYYKLRTEEFMNVGEKVELSGNKYPHYVYFASAFIKGSEFYFEAVVTPYGGMRQKPKYNRKIKGVTLEGSVIDVDGVKDDEQKDKVKIDLFCDEMVTPKEATWFPYATFHAAGENTGWYCMPEFGDCVNLYFPSEREEEAYVTSSERINKDIPQIKKAKDKYWRTKDEKELSLTPEAISISGKTEGLHLILNQDTGVACNSPNKLQIESKGNLRLKSEKKIIITATKTIMLKAGNKSKIVLNEDSSGLIHLYGSKVTREQGQGGANPSYEPNKPSDPVPIVTIAEKGSKNGADAEFYVDNSPGFPWYINEKAEMPNGILTAKWKKPPKGKPNYSWDITIKFDITKHYPKVLNLPNSTSEAWRARVGKLGTKDITHHFMEETAEASIKIRDVLKKNNVNYCGDDVIVKVTALADGKCYNDELKGQILGKNPTVKDVEDSLDQQFKDLFKKVKVAHPDFPLIDEDAKIMRTVIFENESGAKHFYAKTRDLIGLPIYGAPDGWGLMQTDPPNNEDQIWSWKKNIEGTVDVKIKGYIDEIYINFAKKHAMTRWQWRMSIYRRYNGFHFWEWSGDKKTGETKQQYKWIWSGHDEHAYCLKAMRTEKKEFNIDIDSEYKAVLKGGVVIEKSIIDVLREYAKLNWNIWYPKKDKKGEYKSKYSEKYFDF